MAAVPAASLRLPSAAGPSSSVKAAALVSPVPQRRHLSSRFAGLRAARSLFVDRQVSLRRRGVVCEAHNTAVGVQEVTKDTWKSLILESSLPVLVEFWAPWCGPCKMIHPLIGELSSEYSGKLKCYQLNTDENPDVATQYGIRSIPTVMIFKNGEKKEAVIGAVPKSTLTSCVTKFL